MYKNLLTLTLLLSPEIWAISYITHSSSVVANGAEISVQPESPQPNQLIRITLPAGVDEKKYLLLPPLPATSHYLDRSASILIIVVPAPQKLTIVVATAAGLESLELNIGGSPPTPTPDPVPDPPTPAPAPITPLTERVKVLTKTAMNATGTVSTASQLAKLYLAASIKLDTSTDPTDVATALPSLRIALDTLLALRPDADTWANCRNGIDAALIQLLVQGQLSTKSQIVATLLEVGQAMQAVTPIIAPAAVLPKSSKAKQRSQRTSISQQRRLVRR